jgi:hypothetical protein
MTLVGETDYALVDPDSDASLDWSALNLVVQDLKNHGIESPVELEDDKGEIVTPLDPPKLKRLARFLMRNTKEIADESVERLTTRQGHTFRGPSNTVAFIGSAINTFQESIRNRRSMVVEERTIDQITIRPDSVETD